jgi:acyl-CoA thioester hydrolase
MELLDKDLPEGFSTPGEPKTPFTIVQPVSWGDLDAYGHVNNSVYLRWFENARFHYFELVGVVALHTQENKGPILAHTEVDFLAPVRFPEQLLASVRVTRIGNSSFTMENAVWSLEQNRMCARGKNVIVMVDYDAGAKKIRVPEPIRAAIRALEGPGVED